MDYSTTYINRNYLIKVYGFDNEGKRINKLLGVDFRISKPLAQSLNRSFVDTDGFC